MDSAATSGSSSSMDIALHHPFERYDSLDEPQSQQQQQHLNQQVLQLNLQEQICQSCGFTIHDRYLLRVNESFYHESCLRCCSCEKPLQPPNTCYIKSNQIICKEDHANFFAQKCAKCLIPLRSRDFIQRSRHHIYHSACFHCFYCGKHLKPGEEYFCIDAQLICQNDYNFIRQNGSHHAMVVPGTDISFPPGPMPPFFPELESLHRHNNSSKKPPKRPRTILNSQQRKAFKIAFEKGPKPSKKVREQLASETGLSVRVVQVWFQNQRAKIKKIERKQEKHRLKHPNSEPMDSENNGLSPDSKSDDLKSPTSLKSDDESDLEDIDVDSGRSSSATIQRQSSSSSFFSGVELPEKDPIDKLYHMHSTYFAFA